MWHHSGAMRWLCCIVWFITAFAALHYGLMQMGYDFLGTAMLMSYRPFVNYIFGLAGLISLVMWVMHILKGSCEECH